MKIIFLGGWGIYTLNLLDLYSKEFQKHNQSNVHFSSWDEWFALDFPASLQPPQIIFRKPNFVLEEECVIVAWSLGAFCLHAFLENSKDTLFRSTLKKIILISCARSFTQNAINPWGIPVHVLHRMVEKIQKSLHKQNESNDLRSVRSFNIMMADFYKNTFKNTWMAADANPQSKRGESLKTQKILVCNQKLWQQPLNEDSEHYRSEDNCSQIKENLICGLRGLEIITLNRPLPYQVLVLQGKKDLILNHRGAEKMAKDFHYGYHCFETAGHFISADRLVQWL